MPRLTSAIPRLCVHGPTNRACVYLDGRRVYLGRAGSAESRQAYAALLTRLAAGESLGAGNVTAAISDAATKAAESPTINQLLLRYVTEQLPRYVEHEQRCQKGAIRLLRQFFGETPVGEFGPLRLRTVIQAMIAGDPHAVGADGQPQPRKPWTRGFVNRQVKRIRQIFKWGVGWELCPQSVADALLAVASLKAGDSMARETKPRRAIPESDLRAVRLHLQERHQDVIDLLLLTGARPGELFGLTIGDLDRSGDDCATHQQSPNSAVWFAVTFFEKIVAICQNHRPPCEFRPPVQTDWMFGG